jgi:hypothetical protein
MNVPATKPVQWTDRRTLEVVRPEVADILQATPAFKKLSADEQKDIAGAMVKVASYMANPDGLAAKSLASGVTGRPKICSTRARSCSALSVRS